jgi:hypothetical protein
MELSKEQVEQIENYLSKINFDFIDLKVEILDHILSDIENLIIKSHSFEDAFVMTKIRWEKHFRETSSFYFGIQYSESKIVVKKAIKIFKPFFFLYLTAYVLPIIITTNFSITFSKNTIDFINTSLNTLNIVFLFYSIFIFIKVLNTKVKTTYRFILKTQYAGILFLLISLLKGNYFNDDGSIIPFLISFQIAGFAVTYICSYFYKKHKEAIKKYKIS